MAKKTPPSKAACEASALTKFQGACTAGTYLFIPLFQLAKSLKPLAAEILTKAEAPAGAHKKMEVTGLEPVTLCL